MSRDQIPFAAEDISAFAKSLARQLNQAGDPPGHLALMNMLARSAGFQNFQHLRKAHEVGQGPKLAEAPEPVDPRLIERVMRLFDSERQLTHWHAKRSIQDLCTWVLWASLPGETRMSEREISDHLRLFHSFKDPAVLRRRMVTLGLVTRNRDGSDYLRVEQAPPPEARVLMREVSRRRKTAGAGQSVSR